MAQVLFEKAKQISALDSLSFLNFKELIQECMKATETLPDGSESNIDSVLSLSFCSMKLCRECLVKLDWKTANDADLLFDEIPKLVGSIICTISKHRNCKDSLKADMVCYF